MTLTLAVLLCLAAPATAAELEYGVELERQTGTLRVPFASGEARLSPAAEALLQPLVPLLARAPAVVEVAGHADGAGDAAANRALSLRRAEAVKAWLVARGVPAAQLSARGYGADQPLASNQSEAGRAQNRRIAFRLAGAGPTPDALLTSVLPQVKARPAKVPEWKPAALGQPLFRLDEVATAEKAGAELTFRDQSVLRLRERSMAIVLGDEATRPTPGKGTVQLVQGEAHLALAELRAGALTVDTPAAAVAARSRALVIDVDPAQMSRVSVHQGSAQVAAAGATVRVKEGEGTRVAKGRRPEAPAPLPAAPRWAGDGAVARAARPGGAEVPLAVGPVPGAVRYRLEVAADEAFSRPVLFQDSEGPQLRAAGLAPGTYHARVSARDARGLQGPPSAARAVTVAELPVPTSAVASWTPPAAPAPGLAWRVDGAPAAGPLPPGRHRVELVSAAGEVQEGWEVEVQPPPPPPPAAGAAAVSEVAPAAPAPVPGPRLEALLPTRKPGRWGAPAGAGPEGPELAAALDLTTFSRPEAVLALTAEAPWGEGGAVRLRALAAVRLGQPAAGPEVELGAQVARRLLGGEAASLGVVADGAVRAGSGAGTLRAFAVGAVAVGLLDLSTAHGAGAALGAEAQPFYLGSLAASLRLAPDARLSLEGDLALGPAAPAVGLGAGLQVGWRAGELLLGVRAGLTPAGRDEWGQLGATLGWRAR